MSWEKTFRASPFRRSRIDVYVLDTNTIIYAFKDEGRVAERLESVPPSDIAVPTIVIHEVETGIAKSGSSTRRRQLDRFLRTVGVLPFDRHEAGVAARLRASLEKAGTPIGPYDVLIAATAVAAGAILVTRNVNEFRRVDGLEIEDWYE